MKSITRSVFAGLILILVTASTVLAAGPKIEHWVTKNGTPVYFVAAPEIPIVDVRVVYDGGSARDEAKGGLAVLTNGLIAEGAGDLDATEIAKRFDDLGARFSNSTERDMTDFTLRSLADPKYLEPASQLLNLLLTKPTFPQDALNRERKRLLIALQSEKEALDDIADKAFYAAVYGAHPYAKPELGTEETLKSITRQDIRAFYDRYYVTGNALVAIVGAQTREQAEALAERVTAGIPAGKAAPALPAVDPLAEHKVVRIAHPSQQTHLLVGQPGVRRGDPDYFSLYVGNHIFGGSGLVSLLAEEVREKRGLSYSQYSYFSPMRLEGPFIMGLQTRNDQAEQALELVTTLLKEYIEKGPTAEQLEDAKKNITGSFPLRTSSNKRIVEYLSVIGFYNLPLTYLDDFNANIEAVTIEQIRDAFTRRVLPNRLVTVIAGGAAETAGGSGS